MAIVSLISDAGSLNSSIQTSSVKYLFHNINTNMYNYVDNSSTYKINYYLDISINQPDFHYIDISVNSSTFKEDSSTYVHLRNKMSIQKNNSDVLIMNPGYGNIAVTAHNDAVISYVEVHRLKGPDWKISRWNEENTNINDLYNNTLYKSKVDSYEANVELNYYNNIVSFAPVNSDEPFYFDYINISYTFDLSKYTDYVRYSTDGEILMLDENTMLGFE